jgi:hypothetical protein
MVTLERLLKRTEVRVVSWLNSMTTKCFNWTLTTFVKPPKPALPLDLNKFPLSIKQRQEGMQSARSQVVGEIQRLLAPPFTTNKSSQLQSVSF